MDLSELAAQEAKRRRTVGPEDVDTRMERMAQRDRDSGHSGFYDDHPIPPPTKDPRVPIDLTTGRPAEPTKTMTDRRYEVPLPAGHPLTGARKDDQGKPATHLLPADALLEISRVLEHGRVRYGSRNWEKGMNWSRPFGALLRHAWAWWRGEKCDPDTGISHMAHAGCCVLFLLSYELRQAGLDDREHSIAKDRP